MKLEHDFKKYPELNNAELERWELVSPHKQIKEDFRAVVVKVHDGDTITLRCDFRDFDFPLRLLDIDTKEMNAGGAEARDWLKGQILGEEVLIMINRKNRVEKYGRLLGYVISRGMNMNEALIRIGLAVPFSVRREEQIPNIGKILDVKQWF